MIARLARLAFARLAIRASLARRKAWLARSGLRASSKLVTAVRIAMLVTVVRIATLVTVVRILGQSRGGKGNYEKSELGKNHGG